MEGTSPVESLARRQPALVFAGAFAIGLASIATILAAGLPTAVVFQKMVGGMQVFSFLAIPFFIFAGELMLHGGIADKIVTLARNMVGHIRGGLGIDMQVQNLVEGRWKFEQTRRTRAGAPFHNRARLAAIQKHQLRFVRQSERYCITQRLI